VTAAPVEAEIAAVEKLHQAAQARLGIAAAYLALAEWQAVSALKPDATSAAWIVASVRIIVAVRKLSRQLAVNYYQLVRGLEIGSTLGAPENSTGNVTLGTLRKNFRDLALDVAALPSPLSPSDDPDIRWFEEQLKSRDLPEAQTPGRLIRLEDAEVDPLIQDLLDVEDSSTDTDPVTIDEFEWEEAMTPDEVDEEYRALLRKQAREAEAKVRALRASEELSPDQVLTQIEKSHAAAGSVGAGTVDAIGMEGGRQVIDTALRSDRKVKMIARGTSGDPCAFCAMLASRGFVFTGATSGVGEAADFTVSQDIKMYHTNCHCFPIVKFTTTSALPELNRYFKQQWPIVTEGNSGLDALNAWRRWIYAKRKLHPDAPHGARDNKPKT
jgi:hypothetical protein